MHTADPMAQGFHPELVALDIDGTLVDHEGNLPEQVHAAVRRVVDRGVPVVLCTGRGWHATKPVFDALGLPPGYAISSNGSVIVTYPPEEVIREVTFDPADVIDRVAELAPHALVATEVVGEGYRVSGHFPEGDLQGEVIVQSLEELKSRPVTRVTIRDPESGEEDFMKLAHRIGLHGVSYFIGWSAWLDIAPEGVHKGMALAEVANRLGVDQRNVLAMGDGRNDIEMLQWAGRGVALGDAPGEVAAAADVVTGLFGQGGSAAELSRWF